MKRQILHKGYILLLCLMVGFSLAACGGGGSDPGKVPGKGTLSTSLTDSSTDEYQAVYVTVARVEVHHDGDGSWQTVAEPNKTYNLLDLVNGVREPLGIASLDAGHYTQMRLITGDIPEKNGMNMFSMAHPHANYIIDLAGAPHKMKVPSGSNTGLKIVNGFDINQNQTTELILDFDAMRSVVKAGASGKYLLKPTVKVLAMSSAAIVSGIVSDAPVAPVGAQLLADTLVTAQTVATALDEKDAVIIEAGTLTDAAGMYTLFLTPSIYSLVATQTGYLPGCTSVDLAADSAATVDFNLTATTTAPGTISGLVSIAAADVDQYASLDFRTELTCVDALAAATITVKSLNIANGGTYSVDLPAGDYQVISSTFSKQTQVAPVTVTSDTTIQLNVSF